MKNDHSFKFVAAIILAGVIVALISPTHAVHPADAITTTETAHAE